jgi:hypothetical protein
VVISPAKFLFSHLRTIFFVEHCFNYFVVLIGCLVNGDKKTRGVPSSFYSTYLKMLNYNNRGERHLHNFVSAIVRQSVAFRTLFVVLQTIEMFPSIESFGTVMSKKTVFYNDPMKSPETYFKTVKEHIR